MIFPGSFSSLMQINTSPRDVPSPELSRDFPFL